MGLDMIWTGTKRSKAMYNIWRRGRKAGLDTETSLWPTTDIGSGAGHVVALKENWFWNWKKYIKSQEFFNRSLQTVSGATQWLAPRPCWNLALAWKSLGNLGEKSRKSCHWSLGAGVGKGGKRETCSAWSQRVERWGGGWRQNLCQEKVGTSGSISGHLTSILNAGFTCKIEENKLVFSNLTLSYCCICCNCIFLWQLCTNQSDLI